ncbi:GNAT family N-acetyltransferase [Microbacterium sp.]|uniref:GNAT family N-acetyltransferase n=1 Tax=Microbacterium sp. TaxID=51671 RepID=UPI0037352CB2
MLAASPFPILEVSWDDPRAVALRGELDAELDARYAGFHGDEPDERQEERQRALALHPHQVVATLLSTDAAGTPTGHVILRRLGDEWEIKRLMVTAAARGRGVARALMTAALDRAREGGAPRVILQTGIPQPESIALYESMGFARIPVYEPYAETMPRSVCMALPL